MTAIPPGWLGSIIQTQGAHARAAAQKQDAEAAATERAGGGSFAEKLSDVIDETDRDSQVYSDAEGPGGQGRPSDSPPEQSEPSDESDDSPAAGLDLQA
jgi:hypothetical protein